MKLLLAMLFILTALQSGAQRVANTFQAVENTVVSMQKLDAVYPPAIAADTAKAVFKGPQQDKFIMAYSAMLNNLAIYLNQNNFMWEKPTRIFNRIYYAADGSIDYYLVNLLGSGLSDEKQKQFLALLNNFIKTNKINISANTRFAQCSPVIYKNVNN